ncbi:hypothetical protein D1007_18900 [Hordeum vulgare]|nr:hypothetical protein D1007_18900 [Hordeum vulgare]
MTRSKLHDVECNDEYMTEEHIEHENTMCKDVEEGLNDSDDEEYQDNTVANEQDCQDKLMMHGPYVDCKVENGALFDGPT